jgi:PKD repeat protein
MELLPVHLTTQNATTGSNVTYRWTIGNITSTQTVLNTSITSGGIYTLKLVATNVAGSDSATETFRISPFLHTYKSFEGTTLNLYACEGSKMTILSKNRTVNRSTMFKWL